MKIKDYFNLQNQKQVFGIRVDEKKALLRCFINIFKFSLEKGFAINMSVENIRFIE